MPEGQTVQPEPPKTLPEMNLIELERLTSRAATEKGFAMAQLSDPALLDFPVSIAGAELAFMEALESHRKSPNGSIPNMKYTAMVEVLANSQYDMAASGILAKLTPEKKYLIAKLMLISSEVAEAIEAVMELGTDNPKTSQLMVVEEIADIVIRALGMKNELEAAYPNHPGTSVAVAVAEKIVYNASRPHKHGNKNY